MVAAVSDRVIASEYLLRAENLLSAQTGRSVDENRGYVARKLKITVAACANIRRQRRKIVPSWLKEQIVSLFIDCAQNELRAIEHEIEVARQIGLDNSDDKLSAALARAKALVAVLNSVSSEGTPASGDPA